MIVEFGSEQADNVFMPVTGGIYFRHLGRKHQRPIVLIHGAAGDGTLWIDVARKLSKNFRVIVPDLPGHGKSSGQPPSSDVSEYSRSVRRFIRNELGLSRVLLVGHSMGGAVALETALEDPELLAGIVLVSTGARLRVHPAFINTLKEDPDSAVSFLSHAVGPVKKKDEIVRLLERSFIRSSGRCALQDFIACDHFDRTNDIKNITLPALILCGKEDFLTPVKYSYYLKDQLRNSSMVSIGGCGHILMLEAPGKVAKEILKFAFSLKW